MTLHFEPRRSTYRVNDNGIDRELGLLVNKEVKFLRFTNGGSTYVCIGGNLYSLPRRNGKVNENIPTWTVEAALHVPAQHDEALGN